jgi:hypothetical protein
MSGSISRSRTISHATRYVDVPYYHLATEIERFIHSREYGSKRCRRELLPVHREALRLQRAPVDLEGWTRGTPEHGSRENGESVCLSLTMDEIEARDDW